MMCLRPCRSSSACSLPAAALDVFHSAERDAVPAPGQVLSRMRTWTNWAFTKSTSQYFRVTSAYCMPVTGTGQGGRRRSVSAFSVGFQCRFSVSVFRAGCRMRAGPGSSSVNFSAPSGKWPQKMIMYDQRLRTRFAVTLAESVVKKLGPESNGKMR